MPAVLEMTTSLDDSRFFNDKIEQIVRGPESGHNVIIIRRYFRAYLHCWKTVLHLVRTAKGLDNDKKKWIDWCERWQAQHLDDDATKAMDQLRETRDYDTHTGTLVVSGEVAAELFPLVFVDPVRPSQVRKELVTLTRQGLELADRLIATHASFS